jgi:hypothetical protein
MKFPLKAELNMKKIVLFSLIIGALVFFYIRQQNENYYDLLLVSGATPLAIAEKVPDGFSLKVGGFVKKKYVFSGSALNGFATTRIRTREFSPDNTFLGAYIYLGIPVYNILEGIAPKKPDNAVFDQPQDILVTFSSVSGDTVNFSYNELLMTDDKYPVTLAYMRKQILPTTESVRENYPFNVYRDNLSGLKIICPREPDTSRYLENVVSVTFSTLPAPDDLLPIREKRVKCSSDKIICIENRKSKDADFQNAAPARKERWIRIGHGHGFEDVARIEGYDLRSFLTANFPQTSSGDYFLFVACDGYRCLFSGREIFETDDGKSMIIATTINGHAPPQGFRLAPSADFFADRSMWGVSHVVRLPNSTHMELKK